MKEQLEFERCQSMTGLQSPVVGEPVSQVTVVEVTPSVPQATVIEVYPSVDDQSVPQATLTEVSQPVTPQPVITQRHRSGNAPDNSV